ncbi:hypothetical protein [Paraburkholderia guartelaensis]|uniref:DUF3775 domain-containing protein n=1 Tax=Paraburkholderia guartelaensis TaxID=2546446 RepID=A0ABU9SKK7_9BURK
MHEEARTNVGDVEAGLARLRASRDANDETLNAVGVGLGKTWALQYADADEVERVAALAGDDNFADGTVYADAGYSSLRHLVSVANGDDEIRDTDWRDAEDFAQKFMGRSDGKAPDALVRGFVEGVAEVFEML